MRILCLCVALCSVFSQNVASIDADLAVDYFLKKHVPFVCYLTCGLRRISFDLAQHNKLVKAFLRSNIRISLMRVEKHALDLNKNLHQWTFPIGVLMDGSCNGISNVLEQASRSALFDDGHMWLIFENMNEKRRGDVRIENLLQNLNLSINTDIVVALNTEDTDIQLMDVFNFGKIQGNNLEKKFIGTWSPGRGLNISLSRFKYYDRWDLHNLTLRAITVVLGAPQGYDPEMILQPGYDWRVALITKSAAQLLAIIRENHNFRFNYTIADLWVGSPLKNSTLGVTNSIYWGEQDISFTSLRMFSPWMEWVDPFFPPTTKLETKFFYLILDKGVGNYENRFLTPLSSGVWWCTAVASVVCVSVLAVTAVLEERDEPGLYALFSVFAVICQQAYEDGVQLFDEFSSSQGRRLILLVVGLMSMLLYNYYTSSVVSWLLNAAAPTMSNIDELIDSDFELVFEDTSYTRGWLNNPGFFYYSGLKNPKEDILRNRATVTKRTTKLLQTAAEGMELIRSGDYAFHTEPYTAYQAISRSFKEKDICTLGSLQIMIPANTYIVGQKRSPYKKFFVWSLMRLLERGHTSAVRARASGVTPICSGTVPRALALGQAAPAFAILAQTAVVSFIILLFEIYWHRRRSHDKKQVRVLNNRAHNAQEVGKNDSLRV
ncbi:putative chemosensory ionotropic receptor IR1 [Danaus plexippus plexippus]|uniref:Chemosensory ionotropic receptor IR1 n=1 Tax=Danaus plexippus plexippus TaxID=278856 RepID=A0A212F4R3_DANPL|nr:putative chemosensory ionotropic receptor IR1 [Danaus plexippus plexippus]